LVSLLIQTLRFGTSVADTLRVYSEEFRDKRMQAAEEQAAKVGTKLIFPLVFCLFPSFFVVAIGPAIIRIIDVFGQLATNGPK
ncbi:MAG TPA: type II secretion system F family protein, partial [Steroidobacteraceae bacterium]|nr:type II secretion system F family protein [Steroidobacteraceae bacterium]